jgi:hypothetical protein
VYKILYIITNHKVGPTKQNSVGEEMACLIHTWLFRRPLLVRTQGTKLMCADRILTNLGVIIELKCSVLWQVHIGLSRIPSDFSDEYATASGFSSRQCILQPYKILYSKKS